MTRTMFVSAAAAVAASLVLGDAEGLVSAAAAPVNRTVYVSVTDRAGTPVTDLTAREFTVKENGRARDVVEAVPATDPLHVSFIVSDNGTGYFQRPVAQCIQDLLGKGQFAINVVEGPTLKVVDFTADVPALRNGILALARRAAPQPGSQLLEGIANEADALVKRKAVRPVIIVLAFLTSELRTVQGDYVLDRLRDSGASLHVFAAAAAAQSTGAAENVAPAGGGGRGSGTGGGGGTGTGGGRGAGTGGGGGAGGGELRKVLGDGPRQSGGYREDIVQSDVAMPGLRRVAQELLHQYRLTYTLPDGVAPNERLEVETTRKDGEVRAPRRIPVN